MIDFSFNRKINPNITIGIIAIIEAINPQKNAVNMVFIVSESNYEVSRRKAHWSDLTEVSLMGNGTCNEAERKELSGPGTVFNGNHVIAANSFLQPEHEIPDNLRSTSPIG